MICSKCLIDQPEDDFPRRTIDGQRVLRKTCKSCYYGNEYKREKLQGKRGTMKQNKQQSERNKTQRANNIRRGYFLLNDCRNSDRKHKRHHDLDREFVDKMLKVGQCSYCEETELKLTLDRIDNELGHVKDNVRLACIRCNDIRSDMPFEAWIILVPSIKQAREQGLFKGWY